MKLHARNHHNLQTDDWAHSPAPSSNKGDVFLSSSQKYRDEDFNESSFLSQT